jgi:hypothetical protein
MTLADLGNIGEFVGSIAVVITLIYLVIQVRQNTVELRETSADIRQTGIARLVEIHSRNRHLIASDNETAALVMKGSQNYAELNDVEKERFHHLMWDVTLAHLLIWTRINDGILSQDYWEFALTDFVNQWVGKPGGRVWWETTDIYLPAEFRNDVDKALQ